MFEVLDTNTLINEEYGLRELLKMTTILFYFH